MALVNITYHAPEGDTPFVETRGVRFFDGQPVSLDDAEHGELISKCRGNMHFEVEDLTPKQALKALEPSLEASDSIEAGSYREDLIKEAETLGIKVDGRWSDARLETEISTAKIRAAE